MSIVKSVVNKTIASLSEDGWTFDPKRILNKLLSYYILTDTGQSVSFQNRLVSLPRTYHEFINDPVGMSTKMKSELDSLLSKYYQLVDVETDVREIDKNRHGILIYASVVTDDNVRLELGKVVTTQNTEISKIIEINNFGSGKNTLNQL